MYFYLYDSFLQDKKYEKILTDIEARLIDLSIQGRIAKLNILNDLKELIVDSVKQGAETVVVVGDDKTVSRAISAVVDLNVTLGIIPVGGSGHTLASHLGIPEGVDGCDVLSKRIKEKIDIARVNGNYFAFYLKSLSPYVKIISPDRKYSIQPVSENAQVYICNFRPGSFNLSGKATKKFFFPQDGFLEVVVNEDKSSYPSFVKRILPNKSTEIGKYTIIPVQSVILESSDPEKDVRFVLDGDRVIKPPAEINIIPKRVEIIVGKDRMF